MMVLLEQLLRGQQTMAGLEKSLDGVRTKAGLFNGQNITRFMRIYEDEMSFHGIPDVMKVTSFSRACSSSIHGQITTLQEGNTTWVEFKEAILNAFSLDDSTKVTRRGFEDWVASRKSLSIMSVLAEFEERYNKLSTRDRTLLQPDKVMLFLQAVDIQDRKDLGLLLEDVEETNALVNDWEQVKTACKRLSKRHIWLGESSMVQEDDRIQIKEPGYVEPKPVIEQSGRTTQKSSQEIALEEVMKGLKELTLTVAQVVETQKAKEERPRQSFVRRCIWCDSTEHERRDCREYEDAVRQNIIYFQNGKIHSTFNNQPLNPNWRNGGMKKVIEDARAAQGIQQSSYYATSAIIRVDEGRNGSGFWTDAMNRVEKQKVCMEDLERGKKEVMEITGWNDPVIPLTALIQLSDCQAHEVLVDEKRRRMEEQTPRRQEDKKGRSIPPTYKLQSDLGQNVNVQAVVDEFILQQNIQMPLGTFLGVATKEVQENLIDRVRRKKQLIEETNNTPTGVMAQSVFTNQCAQGQIPRSHYTRDHWARATTEAPVQLGGSEESIVALIDHGSEINLMSTEVYKKWNWPLTMDHNWRIRSATKATEELSGACSGVPVKIGDVTVRQNFFIQDNISYPVILGEPYIVAVRMETKVLDNGSSYARIRSQDGGESAQFLTVRPNHARNRELLKDSLPQDFQGGLL